MNKNKTNPVSKTIAMNLPVMLVNPDRKTSPGSEMYDSDDINVATILNPIAYQGI
jgi:hypothetical protein